MDTRQRNRFYPDTWAKFKNDFRNDFIQDMEFVDVINEDTITVFNPLRYYTNDEDTDEDAYIMKFNLYPSDEQIIPFALRKRVNGMDTDAEAA